MLGSTFLSIGTLDTGITPGGFVLGQIYNHLDEWVAHLEGVVNAQGINGYVLARNGEIAQASLSVDGLQEAFPGRVPGRWISPTPTLTPLSGASTATPTITPTPDPEHSPSHTASPTLTPTPSVTPTATPVCASYNLEDAALSYVLNEDSELSCVDDPTDGVIQRSVAGGVLTASQVLLRWDTSSLPDNWVIMSAAVRLHLIDGKPARTAWPH